MSGQRKPHHSGSFARQAKAIRDAANLDPDTRCWQCGRTQAEHGRRWQAGHINDGQTGGPLAPECEGCNASRGATRGNRMRRRKTSRNW